MRPSHLFTPLSRIRKRRHTAGVTFAELLVAMGVAVVLAAILIGSLLANQRHAAAARVMANARIIVQRNIDTALGVKFTSAQEPEILERTTGKLFGDYEDTSETLGDAATPLPIHISKEGDTVVSGQLTRIVRDYPSTMTGLVIREVTFRIDYEFNQRSYQYSMTTLRAQDDQ